MANEKRLDLIDRNELKEKLQEHHDFFVDGVGGFRYLTPKDKARVDEITNCIAEIVNAPTVDAVEVVRCKDCRWAKPYERNDGETGYYCHFCGHAFKYGANWERLYTPIKEADDFCSYGERREGE